MTNNKARFYIFYSNSLLMSLSFIMIRNERKLNIGYIQSSIIMARPMRRNQSTVDEMFCRRKCMSTINMRFILIMLVRLFDFEGIYFFLAKVFTQE